MAEVPGKEKEAETIPRSLYPALIVGVISFALAPILVRYAEEAPPVAVASWRTVTAAFVLAPFAWKPTAQAWHRFSWKEVALIAGAGVFQGLHFITWVASLYYTTVASASVLVTTSPIFLAVAGYLLLGERLRRRSLVAIGVAVCGAGLIAWGDTVGGNAVAPSPLLGNTIALSASLLVSAYLLIGRVVRRRTGWLEYLFPLYTMSAVTCVVTALAMGTPLLGYPLKIYLLCAGLAVGPQLLGHGSFNYALRYLPAAIVSTLALLEPVGASGLAYVLFGEAPSLWGATGMIVTLTSVAVLAWRNQANSQ